MEEDILTLIDEYYNDTKHLQYMADYRDTLLCDIVELLGLQIDEEEAEIAEMAEMAEMIEEQIDYYYHVHNVPQYSVFYYELGDNVWVVPVETKEKIEGLLAIPVVEQRTPEWLEMRQNMLSASNIYRAFKSPATITSLIRDKSTPLANLQTYNPRGGLNNPMGWGTVFERVSVAIYEYVYCTKVGAFGCIRHPQRHFIGASPDGINISEGERYGRMLEIKNIYNREITGIPAEEYWVQMQVQMEVCDLPMCDFLETRFCLFETVEDFVRSDCDFRGALIEYNDDFFYYYLWDYVNAGSNGVDEFMFILNNEKTLKGDVRIYWWYMDEFSCVLVQRNRDWFNAIFPRLNQTWSMIIEARANGDELVVPVRKRVKGVCLIKLDADG